MIDPHLFGWIGLVLIHGSRLPQIYFMLKQKRASGLSLSGTAAVQAGLASYLLYAIAQGDLVFIVSNTVGLIFQGVVLLLNYAWRERGPETVTELAVETFRTIPLRPKQDLVAKDGGFYLRERP